jgi:hypothetical protein
MVCRQTGYLAGTWFIDRQGCWQALGLQIYRQTGLQTGIWTAGRNFGQQADRVSRRHAVWQAKRVADRRPASRHGSRTADRQVGMPAHRLRADRVAGSRLTDRQVGTVADGRQTWWQSCTQTGKQTG